MRQSGSSIVEVIIMMLIISISIVGIYSIVNNGQKLAALTDDKLTAINIAKDGIESLWALRDTFALRNYHASDCFFTINAENYGICPLPSQHYIISDERDLVPIDTGDFSVCVNTNGWYSQEYRNEQEKCHQNDTEICDNLTIKNCKTRFRRKISFKQCPSPLDSNQCIIAMVEVSWWNSDEKQIAIEQILTKIH
jgi:hypothetical protein